MEGLPNPNGLAQCLYCLEVFGCTASLDQHKRQMHEWVDEDEVKRTDIKTEIKEENESSAAVEYSGILNEGQFRIIGELKEEFKDDIKTEEFEDDLKTEEFESEVKTELNIDDEGSTSCDETKASDSNDSKSPSTRKSYSASFKLNVVAYADTHSKKAAAKEFKVARRRVQEWSRQREKLQELSKSAKRLKGGGSKCFHPRVEAKLLTWIQERRDKGIHVTEKYLKREALRLHKACGSQSFKASQGWFQLFKVRHKLSLRRETNIIQVPKEETDTKVNRFLNLAIRMRALRQYRPEDIGHMNETTTWLEMPCSGTAHIEGVKSEGVVGNGQRKRRYTTILGAYADGTKLPPFVLLPGKRSPPSGTVPAGLLIHMCGDGKSVSNDNITRIWLTRVWGRRNDRRRLLVWDTFRGHCTADVKEDVRQKFNSDIVYIPGGCTGILQPADVSWNQPFKDHLQAAYDEWLLSGMPTFTPKGNRRAPQLAAFLRWIKAAWDKVTPDIVRHSFKKCGIWNAEDGTEDQVLLHDDSDSDDEFMGFSNEEIEDSHEVAANMASTNMESMGLDADSDDEEQEEGVDDDDGNSDLDDSTSPGD